jgi:hypothetical protein
LELFNPYLINLKKMKKILFLTLGIAGLMLMTSCSSLKVYSDVDPSIDFSKYKSLEYYGWAEESDKLLTTLDKDRIEKAFDAEFKRRGIDVVESGGDMIVTLFIVVEQKTSTTATTTHMGGGFGGYYGGFYGYGPGYGWGGGHSTTSIQEYDYQVGTLVCDVFDRQDKKLIWEGIGTGEINENPKNRDKNIPKTVQAIMSKFPVRPVGQ